MHTSRHTDVGHNRTSTRAVVRKPARGTGAHLRGRRHVPAPNMRSRALRALRHTSTGALHPPAR
eukprot:5698263-Alexandrium_andersonii.AAC.1